MPKASTKKKDRLLCECGKDYANSASLARHQKECDVVNEKPTEPPEEIVETTAVAVHSDVLPEYRDDKKKELIKRLYFAGSENDDQVQLCMYVGERSGLSFLGRQICAIPRKVKKKDGTYEELLTPQTTIDGYRLVAERSGQLAGVDDAEHPEGWIEDQYTDYEWVDNGHGGRTKKRVTKKYKRPVMSRVTVWKILQGNRVPFTASARWEEYYPGDGPKGFFWRKAPFGQLNKCAEALAYRKGFPNDLSGLYADVEMEKSDAEEIIQHEVTQKGQLDARPAEAKPKFDPNTMSCTNFMEQLNDAKTMARAVEIYEISTLPRTTAWTGDERGNINVCYINSIARVKSCMKQGDIEVSNEVKFIDSSDGKTIIGLARKNADGVVTLHKPDEPAPQAPEDAPEAPKGTPPASDEKKPTEADKIEKRIAELTETLKMEEQQYEIACESPTETKQYYAGLEKQAQRIQAMREELAELKKDPADEGEKELAEKDLKAETVDLAEASKEVFETEKEERAKKNREIHALVNELKIPDEEYRKLLKETFNVESSKDMTLTQLQLLATHLQNRKRQENTPPPPESPIA